MNYKEYRETIEKMTSKELQIAILLYLKDINDLLESFLDSQNIVKKHY